METIVPTVYKLKGSGTLLGSSDVNSLRDTSVIEVERDELCHNIQSSKVPIVMQRIIGMGRYSIGGRIYSSTGERYCAVLRPNKPRDDTPNTLVRQYMGDHILSNEVDIPVSGINGELMSLKINTEVPGISLKALGLLGIVGNNLLLQSLLDLNKDALRLYHTEGILPDIQGYVSNNPIRTLLRSLQPFHSSNIIVNLSTSQPILVDSEIEPSFNQLSKASLRHKILMYSTVLSLHGWQNLFKGAVKMHKLRNKVFNAEVATPEEECVYRRNIDFIQNQLRLHGIDFRIIGSVAYTAYMRQAGVHVPIKLSYENKSNRDIDIMIVNDPNTHLQELESIFDELSKRDKYFPQVSFMKLREPIEESNAMKKSSSFNTKSQIAYHNGQYFAVFRDIIMEIPPELFNPVQVNADSHCIQTLKPDTLLGLGLYRIGYARPKDIEKIKTFTETLNVSLPDSFLDFIRDLTDTYPNQTRNLKMRDIIWYFTGGYESRVKQLLPTWLNNKRKHKSYSK